ncbi:MAG TPA: HAMP domain-containing sensor histidine kinase [Mucilaginibacter sp.]|nr:HAMP domain-containing sensor histidine kinase [Mucilaginibacter sp.]
MKKNLNLIFFFVMISLIGIVIFQVYWCVNAYKVNKKNFDANIDLAMQKAMDDCKKDYFDSIRVVLVRRLSDTSVKIRIDTLREADTVHKQLMITMSAGHWGAGSPFSTTNLVYNYYAKMAGPNPTVPQVLTEMSFYVPPLFHYYSIFLGNQDFQAYPKQFARFKAYNDTHITVPEDTMLKFNSGMDKSIYGFPPNLRSADSLRLHTYLVKELHKMSIYSPLRLSFSTRSDTTHIINAHHSETNEYSYKYHGFKVFGIIGPEFFARAIFLKPQYAIIKGMTLVLILSVLLIVSAIAGFNYLVKTIQKQRKLAELKDDFINNMTHELKTPIATLTVAIEGLQKFNALNDQEKTQRYLQTSRNELVRLNDLVTKVLNISAFENDKIDLVKEKIDVDELLKDVIASEQLKTGKQVGINYQNNGLTAIIADKVHFRNMLVNLVDNAIKYSGEHPKITVSCIKSGNDALISVKDNGPGIPKSHQQLIFDKFHRIPTGNVHNVKGTGLGLSYVKYIAEAHGGTVTVKSEINAGSEFIISIPLN